MVRWVRLWWLCAFPPLCAGLLLIWPTERELALGAAAELGGPSPHPVPTLAAPRGAFVIPADFEADQLRVFAKPGDFALENRSVTLVVRRRDGWLIDFWRNDNAPSTAAQMSGRTHIDGIWQLLPVLHDGKNQVDVVAQTVRHEGDEIETVATLSLGAGRVRVTTSYRLDGDKPRAVITTKFEHIAGGRISHLNLGDAVKWGNTDYFLDGKRQKPTFSSKGRWVGRQGAGGDLRLTTLERGPMLAGARSYHNGLSGEIRTAYRNVAINPGQSVLVQRALQYEPIPISEKVTKTGTLKVTLRDGSGGPLPGKLSISGVGLTSTPNFGNTGGLGGAGRFVWSGTGDFSRTLPPGKYLVWVTAGFERDAKRFQVEILENELAEVSAELPRVVQSPGWLSADLHLHQAPSVDSDISCTARVISVAAEGVELAGATDHFTVADLGPSIAELRSSGQLAAPLLSMMGSEVSTVGNLFGHFNLLPMAPDAKVNFTNTTPKKMFGEMRSVAPKGLLQVNHPRMDKIGYFARYKLDPASMRVPLQFQAEYSDDFDMLEVFNGLEMMSEPKLRKSLVDWIRLLGRGYRYTATGNSDSHNLFFLDPGLPRNFIRVSGSRVDADDLKASETQIVDALRAGRVVVSSGPMLEVDVDGKGPGETVKVREKRAPLRIRVQAAPWISVSSIEILLGGDARRVRYLPVKEQQQVVRFDQTIDLEVSAKTFVVVVVRGNKPLPHTFTPGIKPIAFSNPIWLEPA